MVKIHLMDWQLYCNLKSYCLAPLLTRQEVSFYLLYCFLRKTKTLGIGWSSGCTWEAGFSTSGQAESISGEITSEAQQAAEDLLEGPRQSEEADNIYFLYHSDPIVCLHNNKLPRYNLVSLFFVSTKYTQFS